MAIQRPLAYQLRPQTLQDISGQQHLLGSDGPIMEMAKAHHYASFILYGPAGIGKTSIAQALAHDLQLPFHIFNAAIDAKKKLQAIAKTAETDDETQVILIDEIHRLNRVNQDYLLPYVENGSFLIIGATTENPYISVSPAIRSRCQIFELKPLTSQDIIHAINHALTRTPTIQLLHKCFGDDAQFDKTQIQPFIAQIANRSHGDVRTALNALEYLIVHGQNTDNRITFTDNALKSAMPEQNFNFDANGDYHYDTISAFQKSIRGSDVDAALLYLARLIKSGDLEIIIRRLSVICYEDIGMADPQAANDAYNAIQVAKQVGIKEGRIPLSFAVIRLALAPKSNVTEKSIDNALNIVDHDDKQSIPNHLKDTHYQGAQQLGHQGYRYPHDYPNHIIAQKYLPDNLKDKAIFIPDSHNASDQNMIKRWHNIKHVIRKDE